MRCDQGGGVVLEEPVVGGEGHDRAEDDEIAERQPGTRRNRRERKSPILSKDSSGQKQLHGASKQGERRQEQRMPGEMRPAGGDNSHGPGERAHYNGEGAGKNTRAPG